MRLADVFVAVRADMTDVNQAFKGLESGLGNVQKSLGTMGASLTRNVTLPILAVGGATSKMALDFERSMGQLVGLAGVPAGEIDGIRESVMALASETGRGPQELAEAFYFVASAGFEADEAMKVLDVSSRASAAGLGSVQSVAKVLGGVINSYGQENLSAASAADILTEAVGRGAAEADSFAAALPQVVPTAALLGVEFAEVAGALAAITNTGASASMAAVGLNQVFTTLLKPSNEANDTLAEFGLTAQGLRDQLESEGVIAVLRTLESTFGDNEEAMTKVFGNVRAMRAAFGLLGLDAAQLDEIMGAVAEPTDALAEAFAAIPDDVLAFDRSMADLKVQAILLGRDVLPTVVDIFKEVANAARTVTGWWKGLDKETQQLVIRMALFGAVAGPVLTILSKFVGVAKFAVAGVKGLVIAGKLLHTAWRNIPTALGYVDLAMGKTRGAVVALRSVLMTFALPVTAAISALWLLANVGEHVFRSLNPVGYAFNQVASRVGKSRQEIEGEVNTLAQELGVSADDIRERLTKMLEEGFTWDRAVANLRRGGEEVSDLLLDSEQRWEDYQNQISGAAESTAGRVVAEYTDMTGDLVTVFEDGSVAVNGEVGAMTEEMLEAMRKAREAAVDQMAFMLDGIAALFENDDQVQKAFQDLLDRMDDPYTEAERKADIFSDNMLTLIKKALDSDDPGAVGATIEFVNRMLGEFALLEPGALESGEAVPPAIKNGMDANIQALIDYIEENVTGEALSALTLEQAEQIGIDGIWKYHQGILSQERAASTAASRVGRAALTSLENEVNWTQAGRNIVDLIANGVDENVWRLQSAMRGAAQVARDVLPESPPKDPQSPFHGLGKSGAAIVDMVAGGVTGNAGTLRNAMRSLGDGAGAAEILRRIRGSLASLEGDTTPGAWSKRQDLLAMQSHWQGFLPMSEQDRTGIETILGRLRRSLAAITAPDDMKYPYYGPDEPWGAPGAWTNRQNLQGMIDHYEGMLGGDTNISVFVEKLPEHKTLADIGGELKRLQDMGKFVITEQSRRDALTAWRSSQ